LDFTPAGLSVSPDGAHAYVFDLRTDGIVQITLATGRATMLARVAGFSAAGLATTSDRLYVAYPPLDQVWVFDPQHGRRTQVIGVGHHPVWIGPATMAA
jgi:DNA-binding beta-propeller fold protein YncE